MISVPDVETLFRLFLAPNTTESERKVLNSIIFGGQDSAVNVHLNGFHRTKMENLLKNANFCNIQQVVTFGLFMDASSAVYMDQFISLNMVAEKCDDTDSEGNPIQRRVCVE